MKFKTIITIVIITAIAVTAYITVKRNIGQPIDSFNSVVVYYNGWVGNVNARNTVEGYNIGLKYQCVEFVKRFYFEHLNHKMPNSYGHAKSFFNPNISDGQTNNQRNLTQFSNPSKSKPQVNDLIVMDGTVSNKYGHVCIITKVSGNNIEIIQQNPGPFSSSRETFSLSITSKGKWKIDNDRILGWLRK